MNYTIGEAIEVLQSIAADIGYSGDILATCQFIQENRSDFEPFELAAFDKFMTMGRAMFAPKETV